MALMEGEPTGTGVRRNARPSLVVGTDMALTGTYVPSKQQWVRDQVAEFEASDGAMANTLRDTGYPIVVITSVGAKSGHLRKNPVMRVERDGTYVAIASKGGADDNPEWFHNFVAHPEVELQDGAERHTYVARMLSGDERQEWWDHSVATWPTYGEYQKRTEREIPVFLLERS
jgi:F420H(2)-dependent quinone reductase